MNIVAQFTHDPSGLVFDWVSELSWEVNREFLDYLDQNHNIDVNPSSGEFTFDLECNADQGNNGEYYSEISTTRVRVTRIYDSDERLQAAPPPHRHRELDAPGIQVRRFSPEKGRYYFHIFSVLISPWPCEPDIHFPLCCHLHRWSD